MSPATSATPLTFFSTPPGPPAAAGVAGLGHEGLGPQTVRVIVPLGVARHHLQAVGAKIPALGAATGDFTLAGQLFSPPYSDAGAILKRFYSASGSCS